MSDPMDCIPNAVFAALDKFKETHGREPQTHDELEEVQQAAAKVWIPQYEAIEEQFSNDEIDWKEA